MTTTTMTDQVFRPTHSRVFWRWRRRQRLHWCWVLPRSDTAFRMQPTQTKIPSDSRRICMAELTNPKPTTKMSQSWSDVGTLLRERVDLTLRLVAINRSPRVAVE